MSLSFPPGDILSCPSGNAVPYHRSLERQDCPNKVFIRRSAVHAKGGSKSQDKKCDLSLFNTSSSRPDDVIEGNLPKLNRDKVPERIALVGTGGISHWPATPDSGKVNAEWDAEFMRRWCANDREALLSLDDYGDEATYREAGQGEAHRRAAAPAAQMAAA